MLDFRVNTFLTVCRHMNYTKAADALHITQPAVSQHIHYLEKYYGVKLFSYRNKRLTLTPEGRLLHSRFLTMRNDEVRLRQEILERDSAIHSLSLGVTMTIGEYAIVDPLSRYIAAHPDTNIHLHFGNTAQLLELLDEGRIHLALVEGYYPADLYEHEKYRREDFIAVCAASHHFAAPQVHSLRDLPGERLLVREPGSGTRNILERNLKTAGMEISDFTHYTEVENMYTIIGLLRRDCGISFLYRIAVQDELETGRLKEIHMDDFSMQHDFDFIWEKDSIYDEKYREISREFRQLAESGAE